MLLDLLLPQRCLVCARPGAQVCAQCRTALRRVVAPLCERCGTPTAWPVRRCAECSGRRLAFARARSAVEYDDPVRRIVAAWKERGLRRLADWAAAVVAEVLPRPVAAAICWVPADRDRRLKRGHHAAERLAAALATAWELPSSGLLARRGSSSRQRGMSREARRRNVADAFVPKGAVPARVVLVDDVFTTGATVNAAASALRRGGAGHVEVVTFARTIRIR
jgi:ComF family protein